MVTLATCTPIAVVDTWLTLGHWQTKLTLEAQNEWEQGDKVVISISNPISPVGLFLSQNFSYQSGGFGTYGNYPAAISGGEVKMRTTDNDIAAVRQLYVVTETGSLFELAKQKPTSRTLFPTNKKKRVVRPAYTITCLGDFVFRVNPFDA